jgi:hypothetical protein
LGFDGVDDYLWEDEYVRGPTTYSIETWIKTRSSRGGQIVGYGNGRPRTDSGAFQASTSYDRLIYMENTGQVRFGSGSGQTLRSPQALNDGRWHHLVATQGPSGMRLYVDGVRVGANPTGSSGVYNGVWHVGGDSLGGWPNAPTSAFFAGLIDETAIYPTVLAGRTVAAHAGVPYVIRNLVRPKIKGKRVVGKKLRVTTGTWSPPDVVLTYKWLANGHRIKKASKATFKLTHKQVGKRVKVVVTARAADATPLAIKTKPTGKVRPKPSGGKGARTAPGAKPNTDWARTG